MNAAAWVGLGFVATAENAAPDVIAELGPIKTVCPQIAYGREWPENDPYLEKTQALFRRCRELGLGVAGWAWCDKAADAVLEAQYHAGLVLDLELDRFVANMEEPYDAHGNSGDPRYWAPDKYAQAFRQTAPAVELGLTTTPRWGSSGEGFRAAGAVMMPQAFTGEVPSATIPACVQHAASWGWDPARQRPLVQVYKSSDGTRPSAATYNSDAAELGVGVVPYVVEQAFDGDGQDMIRTLAPSISRPPLPPPVGEHEPPATQPPALPFKRALYPPDAKQRGKIPSPPGPDVEAVKRAVSRAGCWPWRSFSRSYTNEFAHGTGGFGGVAGFQRAVGIKAPTGWYGRATHEALRTYVIPSGANAGEYAFDSYAVALYRKQT